MMRRWKSNYDRYFLSWDFVIGVIFSTILFAFLVYSGKSQLYYENKKEVGLLLINLAISLFGFVLTGITILITCMPEKLKKALRDSDEIFYSQIYGVFFSSLIILGIITILAGISIFIYKYQFIILYSILTCAILLVLRLARSIWVLKHIITIAQK